MFTLNIVMDFWDRHHLIIKQIFAIITAIVVFGWMAIEEDIEHDDPAITIHYRCELIIKSSHEFPQNVVDSCKKLLKEENEIE